MKRVYWESVMRRVNYDSDAQIRQKCIIYEEGNPDPIAGCWDVTVAELIVANMNQSLDVREKRNG